MAILKRIFTWWDGATIGTQLWSRRNGRRIGTDALGNTYFESKKTTGPTRRWVIYSGANDASRVPAEWHGWLHHTNDLIPETLPPAKAWEAPSIPNLTGTIEAYLPQGAIERGGNRAAATGDYEAWSPGA
jgi:NADH:ubiquinone oxidoreductase subunit